MSGRVQVIALLLFVALTTCVSKPEYPSPPVRGGSVVVKTAGMKAGEPVFYTVKIDGVGVSFFVLKLDGTIRSYLDACMKCYPHKKGYRVDGFYLECRYCGVRYPLDNLDQGVGSCYPIPVNGKLNGNEYIISLSELKGAVKYFK
ncbi:MAG: DUF2318 domain-containing protein [Nitrospirae bacterium]|nr:MAG: DUF2318 domain-containing protein [Nitrospirota bacterium]